MPTKNTYQQSGDTAIARATSSLGGDAGAATEYRGQYDYGMAGFKTGPYYYGSVTTFRDVGVPQGRDVIDAKLFTHITYDTGDTDVRIHCVDTDDYTLANSLTDFKQPNPTSSYNDTTMGSNVNVGDDWSWNITNSVQEVINRPGYIGELANIGVYVVERGGATGYKTWGDASPVQSYLRITYRPTHPTSFTATEGSGEGEVDLSWTNEDNAVVEIRKHTDHYPVDHSDGAQVVDNYSGTSYTDTGAGEGNTMFYSIWGSDGVYYSENYATDTGTGHTVTLPTANTQQPTSVGETQATFEGYANDGGGVIDERGFVWDSGSWGGIEYYQIAPGNTDYSNYDNETGSYGSGDYSITITGLSPGTTYYYRAYAHNSNGYDYDDGANEVSFTTNISVVVPTLSTSTPQNIGAHDVDFVGNITDTGGENCDERGFVYDGSSYTNPGNTSPLNSSYANSVSETGSYAAGSYTINETGLANDNTVYYRAYAHNSAGYSYGGQVSFNTLYGQLKRYNGASWVLGNAYYYNGASWVKKPIYVYDSTAGTWKEIETV